MKGAGLCLVAQLDKVLGGNKINLGKVEIRFNSSLLAFEGPVLFKIQTCHQNFILAYSCIYLILKLKL